MSNRTFYQSHECEGFRAKVTIEWDIPSTTEETVIKHRLGAAEDIADSILGFAGKKMRDMVQAMRGISAEPAKTEAERMRDEIRKLHRIWFTGADIDKDAVVAACLGLFASTISSNHRGTE